MRLRATRQFPAAQSSLRAHHLVRADRPRHSRGEAGDRVRLLQAFGRQPLQRQEPADRGDPQVGRQQVEIDRLPGRGVDLGLQHRHVQSARRGAQGDPGAGGDPQSDQQRRPIQAAIRSGERCLGQAVRRRLLLARGPAQRTRDRLERIGSVAVAVPGSWTIAVAVAVGAELPPDLGGAARP